MTFTGLRQFRFWTRRISLQLRDLSFSILQRLHPAALHRAVLPAASQPHLEAGTLLQKSLNRPNFPVKLSHLGSPLTPRKTDCTGIGGSTQSLRVCCLRIGFLTALRYQSKSLGF